MLMILYLVFSKIAIHKNQQIFAIEYSEKMLGRLFNSYGEVLDKKEIESTNKKQIYNDTVSIKDIDIDADILWTGIKVIDFFAPLQKGFKMGLLGGALRQRSKQPGVVCGSPAVIVGAAFSFN